MIVSIFGEVGRNIGENIFTGTVTFQIKRDNLSVEYGFRARGAGGIISLELLREGQTILEHCQNLKTASLQTLPDPKEILIFFALALIGTGINHLNTHLGNDESFAIPGGNEQEFRTKRRVSYSISPAAAIEIVFDDPKYFALIHAALDIKSEKLELVS